MRNLLLVTGLWIALATQVLGDEFPAFFEARESPPAIVAAAIDVSPLRLEDHFAPELLAALAPSDDEGFRRRGVPRPADGQVNAEADPCEALTRRVEDLEAEVERLCQEIEAGRCRCPKVDQAAKPRPTPASSTRAVEEFEGVYPAGTVVEIGPAGKWRRVGAAPSAVIVPATAPTTLPIPVEVMGPLPPSVECPNGRCRTPAAPGRVLRQGWRR